MPVLIDGVFRTEIDKKGVLRSEIDKKGERVRKQR